MGKRLNWFKKKVGIGEKKAREARENKIAERIRNEEIGIRKKLFDKQKLILGQNESRARSGATIISSKRIIKEPIKRTPRENYEIILPKKGRFERLKSYNLNKISLEIKNLSRNENIMRKEIKEMIELTKMKGIPYVIHQESNPERQTILENTGFSKKIDGGLANYYIWETKSK
jgi:hypothetical protein